MCIICIQLDKSFPEPKQLAKAYFETTLTGVDSVEHHKELEAKMDKHISDKGLSDKELQVYEAEFLQEYERLKGLGWPT